MSKNHSQRGFLGFLHSQNKQRKEVKPRKLGLETLENRELLSVTPTEYAELVSLYPNLTLPTYDDANTNIIEITPDQLSLGAIQNAIDRATGTSKSDVIVLRTDADHYQVEFPDGYYYDQYDEYGDQFDGEYGPLVELPYLYVDASSDDSISLVVLGDNALQLGTYSWTAVEVARGDVQLGGLVLIGLPSQYEESASYGADTSSLLYLGETANIDTSRMTLITMGDSDYCYDGGFSISDPEHHSSITLIGTQEYYESQESPNPQGGSVFVTSKVPGKYCIPTHVDHQTILNGENVGVYLKGLGEKGVKALITSDLYVPDADKDYDFREGGDDDSSMCWAATSSNMLYYAGWGAEASEEMVFEDFVYHFENKGGYPDQGNKWYLDGSDKGLPHDPNVALEGAYYKDALKKRGETAGNYVKSENIKGNYSDAITQLVTAIHNDDLAVNINWSRQVTEPENLKKSRIVVGRHAISIWGYVYDPTVKSIGYGGISTDPNYYKKFIITDNNDNWYDIFADPQLWYVDFTWSTPEGNQGASGFCLGGSYKNWYCSEKAYVKYDSSEGRWIKKESPASEYAYAGSDYLIIDEYSTLEKKPPEITPKTNGNILTVSSPTDSLDVDNVHLDVKFNVTSQIGGTYAVSAELWNSAGDWIEDFSQVVDLSANKSQPITLLFDLNKMVDKGEDGCFTVENFKIVNTSQVYDSLQYNLFHTTKPYDVNPKITFKSDKLDLDVNHTLDVECEITSLVNRAYDLTARLTDKNGDFLVDNLGDYLDVPAGTPLGFTVPNPHVVALKAGVNKVTVNFSLDEIVANAVSGEFHVTNLRMEDAKPGSKSKTGPLNYTTKPYVVELKEPIWNLADYPDYKNFKLDASKSGYYTATLYGMEKDETYTKLTPEWDFIGKKAVAKIAGRDKVAENLTITEDAMALLKGVEYDGGKCSCSSDTIFVPGTVNPDFFTIDQKTESTVTQIFPTSPYQKIVDYYEKVLGSANPKFQKIKANYDSCYAKLAKLVKTTTTSYGLVSLDGGATVQHTGVKEASINAGDGDDVVKINSLGRRYVVTGADGADSLVFADAKGRANVELGLTNVWQAVVCGDGGLLKLSDAFEGFVGSPKNDRVVGSSKGAVIDGNGGSDSVTLVGGVNDVTLNGKSQSVVARGTGTYDVKIVDGKYSTVNVAGVNKASTVDVDVEGDYFTFFGGQSAFTAKVVGDYAIINGGPSLKTNGDKIDVVGDHATVTSGLGADEITVTGDYAVVNANSGDDYVVVEGANASVQLGCGNDRAYLCDGTSGRVGKCYVYGGAGNDVVYMAGLSGKNYANAGADNDLIVGSLGADDIYGVAGRNVLVGLDGADHIYGGSGRDLIYSGDPNRVLFKGFPTRADFDWLYGNFYADLNQEWFVELDLSDTLDILGRASSADGTKDSVYSAGKDQVYANKVDGDYVNGKLWQFD